MFCLMAYHLSIVLPSKFILLEFILATRRPVLSLILRVIFSRITHFWSIVLFRCNDFIRSFFIIIFELSLKL